MSSFRTKLYRDDGVVLRCQKLGESDRIITLFTGGTGGCGPPAWSRRIRSGISSAVTLATAG